MVGKWVWRKGTKVISQEFLPNKTVRADSNAKWRLVNKARRTFNLTWGSGWVQTITLESNGKKAIVQDQHGTMLAERVD